MGWRLVFIQSSCWVLLRQIPKFQKLPKCLTGAFCSSGWSPTQRRAFLLLYFCVFLLFGSQVASFGLLSTDLVCLFYLAGCGKHSAWQVSNDEEPSTDSEGLADPQLRWAAQHKKSRGETRAHTHNAHTDTLRSQRFGFSQGIDNLRTWRLAKSSPQELRGWESSYK